MLRYGLGTSARTVTSTDMRTVDSVGFGALKAEIFRCKGETFKVWRELKLPLRGGDTGDTFFCSDENYITGSALSHVLVRIPVFLQQWPLLKNILSLYPPTLGPSG